MQLQNLIGDSLMILILYKIVLLLYNLILFGIKISYELT